MSTATAALQENEDAYRRHDLEAAVRCKDFQTEAALMLEKLLGSAAPSEDMIRDLAGVLEGAFRAEISQNGFPNFEGITAEVIREEEYRRDLMILTERITFADSQVREQKVLASKRSGSWRIVGLFDDVAA